MWKRFCQIITFFFEKTDFIDDFGVFYPYYALDAAILVCFHHFLRCQNAFFHPFGIMADCFLVRFCAEKTAPDA